MLRRLGLLLPTLRKFLSFYKVTAIYACVMLTVIAALVAIRTWPTLVCNC